MKRPATLAAVLAGLCAGSLAAPLAENLKDAPYVNFVAPLGCQTPGAGGAADQVVVEWQTTLAVEGAVDAARAAELERRMIGSQVCIAFEDGEPHCQDFAEPVRKVALDRLAAGCYTLKGWWVPPGTASVRYGGTLTSHLIRVGRSDDGDEAAARAACPQTCASEAAAAATAAAAAGGGSHGGTWATPVSADGGGGGSGSGVARYELPPPPNAVTGGCLLGGACETRCAEGCCDGSNPMHMCTYTGLPVCSECVTEVSPAQRGALPAAALEANLGVVDRSMAERYVELMGELVMNTPYEDYEAAMANFDTLRALTMVERERIVHLHALVVDVLMRGVPGDMIEAGEGEGRGQGTTNPNQLRQPDQSSNLHLHPLPHHLHYPRLLAWWCSYLPCSVPRGAVSKCHKLSPPISTNNGIILGIQIQKTIKILSKSSS